MYIELDAFVANAVAQADLTPAQWFQVLARVICGTDTAEWTTVIAASKLSDTEFSNFMLPGGKPVAASCFVSRSALKESRMLSKASLVFSNMNFASWQSAGRAGVPLLMFPTDMERYVLVGVRNNINDTTTGFSSCCPWHEAKCQVFQVFQ